MKHIVIPFFIIMSIIYGFQQPLSSQESGQQPLELRASIDFGSGSVKVQAAFVDRESHRIIGRPLLAAYLPLALTEDVAAHNGYFSEEAMEKAVQVVGEFKKKALLSAESVHSPEIHFSGVATAVFRKGKNSAQLIDKIDHEHGIRFKIISQEDEGHLGFLSAQALYPDILEEHLLAWDSGNGSFQLTAKDNDCYKVYEGPLGHGTSRILLSHDIRADAILQNHESGNPITLSEAQLLASKITLMLPPIPFWLQKMLAGNETCIATFGDGESIFALVAQAIAFKNGSNDLVQEAVVHFSDVEDVLRIYVGYTDNAFAAINLNHKTATASILLRTVMQHFGIKKIYYRRSLGSTAGILINPEFWGEEAASTFRL